MHSSGEHCQAIYHLVKSAMIDYIVSHDDCVTWYYWWFIDSTRVLIVLCFNSKNGNIFNYLRCNETLM